MNKDQPSNDQRPEDQHPYHPTIYIVFPGEPDVGIPQVNATLTFDWPALEAEEDPDDLKDALRSFMITHMDSPMVLVRYDYECPDCFIDHEDEPCPLEADQRPDQRASNNSRDSRDSHVVPSNTSYVDFTVGEHAIVVTNAKSNGYPTNYYIGTCTCGFTGSIRPNQLDAGQDALDQHPNPFTLIGVEINGVWFVPDHTRDLEYARQAKAFGNG